MRAQPAYSLWLSSKTIVTAETIYEGTYLGNNSTGQFEGGDYLEAASSLSAARFEGTGLLQDGSYTIGCKHKTRENSLILEANI